MKYKGSRNSNILRNLIIGLLAGTAVALGGAIKDSRYEGFDMFTFIRSPIIGAIEGMALGSITSNPNPLLLLFAIIGIERLTIETWKVFRGGMPMKHRYGEWGRPPRMVHTA